MEDSSLKKTFDRRAFERVEVHDCIIAFPASSNTKFGKIKDISLGGVTVRHFDEKKWETGTFESDIILNGHGINLEKIPVKIKFDREESTPTPFYTLSERLCGVQFKKLTHDQSAQLQYFIDNYDLELFERY